MSKLVWCGTLAILVALSLSLPAKADHGKLSADALQALLPGATGYGTSSRGAPLEIEYFGDGTQTITVGSNFSDRGKWWIEEGNYCSQWDKIRKGEKGCFFFFHKSGDDYHYEQTDGSSDGDIKIVK